MAKGRSSDTAVPKVVPLLRQRCGSWCCPLIGENNHRPEGPQTRLGRCRGTRRGHRQRGDAPSLAEFVRVPGVEAHAVAKLCGEDVRANDGATEWRAWDRRAANGIRALLGVSEIAAADILDGRCEAGDTSELRWDGELG